VNINVIQRGHSSIPSVDELPEILHDFKDWIGCILVGFSFIRCCLAFSVPKLILHDPICYQMTRIIKCARKDCRLPTGGVE
jgi:hypothetical protein